MRALWRRSFALVRNHPILWLPYLCAAILATGLASSRRIAEKGILQWQIIGRTTSHSVLIPNLVESHFDDAAFMRTAERIHSVLRWTVRYVDDCLYALAIVLTALLLNMILSEQGSEFRDAMSVLRTYPKRILVYASKYWMLSLALMVIVTMPAAKLSDAMASPRRAATDALFIGADVLWAIVFAWVIAPIAIALLRPAGAVAATAEERRWSMSIYFLIQMAAFLLSHFVNPWLDKLPLEPFAENVAMEAAGIVFNLPFVLLYVAFALIAQPDLLGSQVERPSAILAFLMKHRKSLMPLHFDRGKEL